jgi:hypothetical protein
LGGATFFMRTAIGCISWNCFRSWLTGSFERLTQALAIGSTAFLEGLRLRLAQRTGAWTKARAWRRLLPFRTMVLSVETAKQASWKDFVDLREEVLGVRWQVLRVDALLVLGAWLAGLGPLERFARPWSRFGRAWSLMVSAVELHATPGDRCTDGAATGRVKRFDGRSPLAAAAEKSGVKPPR